MPRQMTPQERQEFLAEPHVGVLSVASDDDRPPLTVPLWYGYRAWRQHLFLHRNPGPQSPQDRAHPKWAC